VITALAETPGTTADSASTSAPTSAPSPASAPARAPAKPASATVRLTGNRLLSRPGAGKEIRRFTFDTRYGDTPLAYEAGDALGVRPANSPEAVAEWLAVTELDD